MLELHFRVEFTKYYSPITRYFNHGIEILYKKAIGHRAFFKIINRKVKTSVGIG
jgi:hypothetical protein